MHKPTKKEEALADSVEKRYVTPEYFAEYFGVSLSGTYNKVRSGYIASVRILKKILIPRSEIDVIEAEVKQAQERSAKKRARLRGE